MEEIKEVESIEKEVLNVEKLVDMLKHIHNDVENMRRDLVIVMHKVDGIAFLHEVTRRDVEEAINSFDINLDDMYSPIDAKDREEWRKHLESEIQEKD
jgi:putative NIF3 family GTP cyclohydrolase 1 type 2